MFHYCVLKAGKQLIQPKNAFLLFFPVVFFRLTIIMLPTHNYKFQHWLLILISSSVLMLHVILLLFILHVACGSGELSFKSVQAGHDMELVPPKARE